MENKPGKLSNQEMEYIREHMDDSAEDIGKVLRRNADTIKKYVGKIKVGVVGTDVTDDIEIVSRLTERKDWPSIERQFSKEELGVFKEHWVKHYKQFNYDVLPTEELQMINAIRFEILINRNMEQRNTCQARIDEMDVEIIQIEKEIKLTIDPDERHELIEKATELKSMRNITEMAITTRTGELEKFTTKLQASYKDLKSTRDQRYRQLQDNRTNFIDWLKDLDNRDFISREGKELALRKLAFKKEKERLSGLHTFLDGKTDQLLLTPETLLEEA